MSQTFESLPHSCRPPAAYTNAPSTPDCRTEHISAGFRRAVLSTGFEVTSLWQGFYNADYRVPSAVSAFAGPRCTNRLQQDQWRLPSPIRYNKSPAPQRATNHQSSLVHALYRQYNQKHSARDESSPLLLSDSVPAPLPLFIYQIQGKPLLQC